MVSDHSVEYQERRRRLAEAEAEGERIFARLEAKAALMDQEIQRARRDAVARRGEPPGQQLRLAAYHESAHGVGAILAGGRCHGLAVFSDGSGHAWTENSDDVGHLAGAASERVLGGNLHATPSESDLSLVRGGRYDAMQSQFDAEEAVALHSKQITRVADLLLEFGHLSGELVHDIAGSQFI